MTTWDTFFLVLGVVDLIAVGVLIWTALRFGETYRRAERRARPALREARSLAVVGRTLFEHSRATAAEIAGTVREVRERVARRIRTTRHILSELAPGGPEEPGTPERAARLLRRARSVGEVAWRLRRIRSAAEKAAARAHD